MSQNAQIYSNTLEVNFGGISYFLNCSSLAEGFDLQNNATHDNTVVIGTASNTYANGRVIQQTLADPNATYQLAYTVDGSGNITQTDVIDPRGHVERLIFNSSHYATSDTHGHSRAARLAAQASRMRSESVRARGRGSGRQSLKTPPEGIRAGLAGSAAAAASLDYTHGTRRRPRPVAVPGTGADKAGAGRHARPRVGIGRKGGGA